MNLSLRDPAQMTGSVHTKLYMGDDMQKVFIDRIVALTLSSKEMKIPILLDYSAIRLRDPLLKQCVEVVGPNHQETHEKMLLFTYVRECILVTTDRGLFDKATEYGKRAYFVDISHGWGDEPDTKGFIAPGVPSMLDGIVKKEDRRQLGRRVA